MTPFLSRAALAAFAALCVSVTTAAAPAPDRPTSRCGWFVNPTPGNAWLLDRDGEWVVGLQGGHQADGDWPDFTGRQWVRRNGSYGYGCACLVAVVNPQTKEVRRIDRARARPLDACRQDPRLPKPDA
jgi:hypothetical protein